MNRLSSLPLAATDWARANLDLSILADEEEEKIEMPVKQQVDISGKKFNDLTALYDTGRRNDHNQILWVFKCSCGTEVEKVKGAVVALRIPNCGGENHQRQPRKARNVEENGYGISPSMAGKSEAYDSSHTMVITKPSLSVDFRTELIETGKDITTLIRFARKLDPAKVRSLLEEIERVASSPFAQIPEGAQEEALAAQEFISKLQAIL
jgi:hypothetical protein